MAAVYILAHLFLLSVLLRETLNGFVVSASSVNSVVFSKITIFLSTCNFFRNNGSIVKENKQDRNIKWV